MYGVVTKISNGNYMKKISLWRQTLFKAIQKKTEKVVKCFSKIIPLRRGVK